MHVHGEGNAIGRIRQSVCFHCIVITPPSPPWGGALSDTAIRPSVRLSVPALGAQLP